MSGKVLDYVLRKLTEEKYTGERHVHKYNWCGSRTSFQDRLNYETMAPKKGSEPINAIDEACLLHDLAYYKNKQAYEKLCPVQKREARQNFQEANWRADNELVNRVRSMHEADPKTSYAIRSAIRVKEWAEKNKLLDTKVFSGIGKKRKNKMKK
jgi:hypothetical protein